MHDLHKHTLWLRGWNKTKFSWIKLQPAESKIIQQNQPRGCERSKCSLTSWKWLYFMQEEKLTKQNSRNLLQIIWMTKKNRNNKSNKQLNCVLTTVNTWFLTSWLESYKHAKIRVEIGAAHTHPLTLPVKRYLLWRSTTAFVFRDNPPAVFGSLSTTIGTSWASWLKHSLSNIKSQHLLLIHALTSRI